MSESELNRRANELGQAVAGLGESIAELAQRTEVSEDQLRRSRRAIRWTVGGVALDVLLTVVVVILFHQGNDLETVQKRTSNEVLCPLYQVFMDSYDPKRRDAMAPEQRAKYDGAFAVITRGANVLGCHR